MRKIFFCLLLYFTASTSSNDYAQFINLKPITFIEYEKTSMDKFFNHAVKSRNKQIMVWAKVKGKPIAIKVNNGKWPDNIEYSYNLITDTVNHTTLVLASPYSESGDWDIDYLYYFDANGKLFSFERRTGFFNSECTTDDDAAHETITYYYNSQFKQIRKFYRLQDSKGRNLIKSKCILNYDFTDYKIYKTLNDCLKGNHINIQ